MINATAASPSTTPGPLAKGASPAGGDLFALSMLAVGAGTETALTPTVAAEPSRQTLAGPGMPLPTAAAETVDPALLWLPAVNIVAPEPMDVSAVEHLAVPSAPALVPPAFAPDILPDPQSGIAIDAPAATPPHAGARVAPDAKPAAAASIIDTVAVAGEPMPVEPDDPIVSCDGPKRPAPGAPPIATAAIPTATASTIDAVAVAGAPMPVEPDAPIVPRDGPKRPAPGAPLIATAAIPTATASTIDAVAVAGAPMPVESDASADPREGSRRPAPFARQPVAIEAPQVGAPVPMSVAAAPIDLTGRTPAPAPAADALVPKTVTELSAKSRAPARSAREAALTIERPADPMATAPLATVPAAVADTDEGETTTIVSTPEAPTAASPAALTAPMVPQPATPIIAKPADDAAPRPGRAIVNDYESDAVAVSSPGLAKPVRTGPQNDRSMPAPRPVRESDATDGASFVGPMTPPPVATAAADLSSSPLPARNVTAEAVPAAKAISPAALRADPSLSGARKAVAPVAQDGEQPSGSGLDPVGSTAVDQPPATTPPVSIRPERAMSDAPQQRQARPRSTGDDTGTMAQPAVLPITPQAPIIQLASEARDASVQPMPRGGQVSTVSTTARGARVPVATIVPPEPIDVPEQPLAPAASAIAAAVAPPLRRAPAARTAPSVPTPASAPAEAAAFTARATPTVAVAAPLLQPAVSPRTTQAAPSLTPAEPVAAPAPIIAASAPVRVDTPVLTAAAPVTNAPIPLTQSPVAPSIADPAASVSSEAGVAVTAQPPRAFVREVSGGARQTIALRPQAAALPQPLAGTTAPAAWIFGAAIHAASGAGERPRAEPVDPTIVPVAATSSIAATTTPADLAQPALDMRQGDWPATMIDRIETLRDTANANDTRIRLVPDALGVIDVAVKTVGDAIHVHFAAEDATTRARLEEARPTLALIAEERGIRIGQTIVEAAPANAANAGQQGQANQQPGQQQPQQQGQQPSSAGGSAQQQTAAQTQTGAQTGQQQPRQQSPQTNARQPASPARTASNDTDAAANGRIA